MENRPTLVILGAGDFAKVAADLVESHLMKVSMFIVDQVENERIWKDVPVISLDKARMTPTVGYVCAIMSPKRKGFIARAEGMLPIQAVRLTSIQADLSEQAFVGQGCIVCRGAVVDTGVILQQHVIVNRGATIGHHVSIGRYSTIGPGANLAGRVKVGEGVTIGMGANIREGVRIGDNSVVGMGSVVLESIPENEVWWGVPAGFQHYNE